MYNSRTCKISFFNLIDIGNYCLPNLDDLGIKADQEEKIRESYNALLNKIGANAAG